MIVDFKTLQLTHPQIATKACEIFGASASSWMSEKIQALNGKSPYDVLDAGDEKAILLLLRKIECGEFS